MLGFYENEMKYGSAFPNFPKFPSIWSHILLEVKYIGLITIFGTRVNPLVVSPSIGKNGKKN